MKGYTDMLTEHINPRFVDLDSRSERWRHTPVRQSPRDAGDRQDQFDGEHSFRVHQRRDGICSGLWHVILGGGSSDSEYDQSEPGQSIHDRD